MIAAPFLAHAEIGLYEEGGLGKAHGSDGLETFEDGGLAVRAALGMRAAHWGGELYLSKAELDDETGFYTAFTFGPMFTARHVLTRTKLDPPFERWLEVYARIGPTFTVMTGDPGDGPADGANGVGVTAGGGIRWVYAAIGFSLDVTFVRANLHKDAKLHDELGVMDEPAFDLSGNIVAVTLGIGFVL